MIRTIRMVALALLLVAHVSLMGQSSHSFWVHPPAPALRAANAVHVARSPQKIAKPEAVGKRKEGGAATSNRPATKVAEPAGAQSIAEALATGHSSQWTVVVGLTLLTLAPAILLAMTPLIRLLVVFHFLRQALGTQTAPSNQVLMALGLMMTWFLMQPVITQVNDVAVAPYRAGVMSGEDALSKATVPVKTFMLRYARDKDLELFAAASQPTRLHRREDAPMQVVVPAYMLSELKSGFQIGAILFLPFLLVDLVVASVTTSIGMLQMPPTVISTPVKILLFVMVDGWHLLASSLLKSF
ncbi:flagellar type III secretion system pore protein FliP [Terriglobus sp. RCC_193]|uniref:flagellar type III secretion system pore protein FliP n=1 Tax=Terriglobus sp. RCC_193 TaxID=3239218 RepID=UPI003525365E